MCTAMPERGVRGRDYAGDPVKGFSRGIVIEDGQQKLPTPGHSLTLCGRIPVRPLSMTEAVHVAGTVAL